MTYGGGFVEGRTYEALVLRTDRDLVVSIDGAAPRRLIADDGFLPLSREPSHLAKGQDFKGEVLSVRMGHGGRPAEVPRTPTRGEIFGKDAR